MSLRIGETAPDFDLTSSDGKPLRLSDYRGKKNVVLYFYPGDFTPICTKETCGFRDVYEELRSRDTEIIGVSVDSDDSHTKFASKFAVPFPLYSDKNLALSKKYDAVGFLRGLFGKTGRVTYVVDKKGMIAGVFASELRAGIHVGGVRELIAKLA